MASHHTPRPGQSAKRDSEQGTALTELAILVPIFVIVFMWAQFFVDLGLVKLKAEEASRFALWEMTVQQPTGGTISSVRDRFRDLASPQTAEFQRSQPIGTHSFTGPVTIDVQMSDRLGEPFGGRIPQPEGGGIIGQVMGWIARFAGQVADSMLRRFGLDTNTSARVDGVAMTVPNRIFPGFSFLPYLVRDPGPPRTVTVRAASPRMMVDSWKAWASKYNPSGNDLRNIETSVYESYGSSFPGDDGLPERVVSARVRAAAFFGLGQTLGNVGRAFTYVGFRNPLSTDTHAGSTNSRDQSGPITMLPGKVDRRANSVASGRPVKRYGAEFSHRDTPTPVERRTVGMSGEDHFRFTVPGIIHSTEWSGSGGTPARSLPTYQTRNPYTMMYDCRDGFYMGSIRGGGPGNAVIHHRTGFSTWQQRMYRGCPTGANQW